MAENIEFLIKTKADINAAKQVEQQLEKDIAKLRVLGTETDKLAQKQAQLNKVRASLAAAPQQPGGSGFLDALKDKASGIPGVAALSGGAAAAFAAIGGAAALAAKGLNEFAGAQTRVAGLDAALAQTGQLTDEYREKLQALAAEMQTTTGVADDEWIGVLQRLTQFGSTAETIERDTEAVKNLAGILGGDLASASQLISRANQGQFQSFSRMGIVIDDTGTKTEKLAKLYEELAQRGGGQLEARSKTLTGQFAQLKNATSDFFEAIGRVIAGSGVLQFALTTLTDIAANLADAFGGTIKAADGLRNSQRATRIEVDQTSESISGQKTKADALTKAVKGSADAFDSLVASISKTNSQEQQLLDLEEQIAVSKFKDEAKAKNSSETDIQKGLFGIKADFQGRRRQAEKDAAERQIALQQERISDLDLPVEKASQKLNKARENRAALDAQSKDVRFINQATDTVQSLREEAQSLQPSVVNGSILTEEVKQRLKDIEQGIEKAEEEISIRQARLRGQRQIDPNSADVGVASAELEATRAAVAAEKDQRRLKIGDLRNDDAFAGRKFELQRALFATDAKQDIRGAAEKDTARLTQQAESQAKGLGIASPQIDSKQLDSVRKVEASANASLSLLTDLATVSEQHAKKIESLAELVRTLRKSNQNSRAIGFD